MCPFELLHKGLPRGPHVPDVGAALNPKPLKELGQTWGSRCQQVEQIGVQPGGCCR